MFVLLFISGACLLLLLVSRSKKHIPPKRTERQKQTDELVTVILPTINHDK